MRDYHDWNEFLVWLTGSTDGRWSPPPGIDTQMEGKTASLDGGYKRGCDGSLKNICATASSRDGHSCRRAIRPGRAECIRRC
jgi:hypothetical protein